METVLKNRSTPARSLLIGATLVTMLGACGTIGEGDRIDYRGAAQANTLEVPPDLTTPAENDRFSVSDISPRGVATYSAYNSERGAAKSPDASMPAATVAAAAQSAAAKPIFIERAGSQRWLVVEGAPEKLWPEVREFWIGLGFVLNIDRPEIGIMETDWAEDRAKIPDGFIRQTLGRVLDNVFSTPERDKFRTRLESGRAPGVTEIFISHRGVMEIFPDEARAFPVVGSDERNGRRGLGEGVPVETIVDVDDDDAGVLGPFEYRDERLRVGRSDDDGIDAPCDHLLDEGDLLGEVGLVADAVDDEIEVGGVVTVVGLGTLGHGLEEFVGERLHDEGDLGFARCL